MDALRSRFLNPAGATLIALVMAALVCLVGRLVYINTHDRPRLLAQAARQQVSVIPIKHRRGLIADCQGRIISCTMLRKSVFMDPGVVSDKQAAAERAAEILHIDAAEIKPDLLDAGDRRFLVVRRGVTEEQARSVKRAGIYGLGVFDEPYRIHPMNGLGAALIGFVAPDGHGISGLEYQCDAWLRGENGVKTIVRDAQRKAFWLADGGYRPARDGFHVVLTLDAEIQAIVERELAAGSEQYAAESGVAVVMRPQTGEILAMANYPGFDPNQYGDYGASRYRNRAITDPIEPGSTFKPFIAAGALAEGKARLGTIYDCEMGAFKEGRRTLHDHHPYGLLTFEEVLIKSSNIGMAKMGKALGNERLHRIVKGFGFGKQTGIDLLGEDAGIVRSLPRWNDYTTTSIPMGQEIAVTPLQITRAFCAFANGGQLVRPHVIQAVLAADGRVISDFSNPPTDGQAIPEDIAEIMKNKVLCRVVSQGTGSKSQLANHRVFGKTGTAQIAKKGGGGYEPNAYVSSFIAGAPVSDPELVVFVALTRPDRSRGYYGGTVAAPIVREILTHALAYLQVPPDKPFTAITYSSDEHDFD